ncbi:IPT/TIG domain-containing protein [Legionella feeleii]|uniref:Protein with a bacterial immunoglobulin-like domain n=1 Tax=Legionella feeleii TaxID=453 RepID=A0A378KNF8_9GAMM|nr:IPT/TIG domain-containing protein [Legionella feeleii]STX88261.1 protein with a bacterial immunoglobulin-like domain [Legionella feeleii]STX88300.1 protein with a bacterial immunoglobulin-like domain [Legionella feeleii]
MPLKNFSAKIIAASFFVLSTLVHSAAPLWTFTPLTQTSFTIPSNGTAQVQYRVTNQDRNAHTLALKPTDGLKQINTNGSGLCGNSFRLPEKGSSCVLSLQINGSQISNTLSGGPVVCQQPGGTQCYQPKPRNSLNVRVNSALDIAAITVTGSPLVLVAGGPSGNLTIQNTSLEVTATNVNSNFTGTALAGNVTQTGSTCASLPPGGSCTLTFTPGNTPVAQTNFSIQGDNTNSALAAIAINDAVPTLTSISPTTGTTNGGTPFTVDGTGLTNLTSLTFDGLPATNISVIDDTMVSGLTPAHAAGAVDVVATTPGGQATLTNGYTYQAPILPVITAINPTSGTTSGNTFVTLTGTGLSGTTSVTFDGLPATSINVISVTMVTAVTPAHAAGAIDVTLTTPAGNSTLPLGYTYLATAVGQPSGGGVIGCLGGGLQNLIAASADVVTGNANNTTAYSPAPFSLTPAAQSTTDGATNTAAVFSNYGTANYAASFCTNYEIDAAGNSPCQDGNTCYTDWFLPALDQLNCLYQNQVAIGGFATSGQTNYWSSTEVDLDEARTINFLTGVQSTAFKNSLRKSRCVRSFNP